MARLPGHAGYRYGAPTAKWPDHAPLQSGIEAGINFLCRSVARRKKNGESNSAANSKKASRDSVRGELHGLHRRDSRLAKMAKRINKQTCETRMPLRNVLHTIGFRQF
jgi:hypothetical protein